MNDLTITIPISNNKSWFNSFITAIFYTQYSRELLKKDDYYKNKALNKDDIFKLKDELIKFIDPSIDLTNDNAKITDFFEKNHFKLTNDKDKKQYRLKQYRLKQLLDPNDIFQEATNYYVLYEYLIKHIKQFTPFILPKFLHLINLSSITIERCNGKNYIGLYNFIEMQEKKNPIKTSYIPTFLQYNKDLTTEKILGLKSDIKNTDIKELYNKSVHPDFITINKWNDKSNIPDFFSTIIEKNNTSNDIDGINNKFRLSSLYKKDNDLKIEDDEKEIQLEIEYNEYIYKLNSCIISNYNEDNKTPITCSIYNNKKYVYIDSHHHPNDIICNNFTKFNWQKKTDFIIYNKFPCNNIFTIKNLQQIGETYSIFSTKNSNYTLIYVKYKSKQEKGNEKAKETLNEKEQKILKLNDQNIKEIKRISESAEIKKHKDLKNAITYLYEYKSLLENNTDLKLELKDCVSKIIEIQQDKKKLIENKEKDQKIKEEIEKIIKLLDHYTYYLVTYQSQENTLELLKELFKTIPNDIRISQIFKDLINSMPKDPNIAQILDEIAKLPTEAKIIELLSKIPNEDKTKIISDAISKLPNETKITELLKTAIKDLPKIDNKVIIDDLNKKIDAMQQLLLAKIQEHKDTRRSKDNSTTLQPEIDDLKKQLQSLGDIQKTLAETAKKDQIKLIDDLSLKLDSMQKDVLSKLQNQVIKSKSSNNLSLQQEISDLKQQLKLLEDIQTKLSQNSDRDNKQLLDDMQDALLKYSKKDNDIIIRGVQDLLRLFNKDVISKLQIEKDSKVHTEIDHNIKEQLLLLKDIQLKLEKDVKSSSKKDSRENALLKVENTELKKQIAILEDIQLKCKRQQKEYQRCNKHNTLPYKYIKFKEDELLDAIRDKFKLQKQPNSKIIIDFIFNYFEKNNKVMNVYIIEKYMGDIYDVMKIFNKKYNIDTIDIKQFYRLLAAISIYAKYQDDIKKIFLK